MDFLRNTKNGRVLPWTPVLDKLPYMEIVAGPEPVAEPKAEGIEAMTRAELIEKAKAEGLPAKAAMKREELLALFAPAVEAEGDDL